jgi:glyoxylase-like metal-dependent hydrolase (beta-lactamase superfamily II)
MQLHVINTGYFKLDGGAMFGVVPKSMWNKLNPADENNMCTWALRCLLIEDGNRKILIDTGMGDKQDAKFFSHYYLHGNDSLLSSLQAKGFSTDDITDVVLTHLHFDHCGGAIINEINSLIPQFKNATYWSNTLHWQAATKPNAREKASFLKDNILPIESNTNLQMIPVPTVQNNELLLSKQQSFTNEISMRFCSGHTTAMMLPQIQYKQHTIVFMADLLPSVAHIPLPYVMAYDMQPLLTLQEKQFFLQEAAAKNYILFLEHDPIHECCTVEETEKGIRVKTTGSLHNLLEMPIH